MIKKIAFLTVLLITLNSVAQKNNISPYSFFGIGEATESKSVSEENMGGIGGAQNSPFQISYTNPASYAALRFTTLAVAGKNKYLSVDDGTNKESTSSFNLSYLTLGFPVGKKSGMVFGVKPSSKVGYSISNNITDTEKNIFFGEGGTNRVFLGFGQELPYNISIGLEASYLFGNVERRIYNTIEDVSLATMHQTNNDLSGFLLKLGIQNKFKLTDKLVFKTGLTFNLENDLKSTGNERLFSLLNITDPTLIDSRPSLIRDEILNRDFDNDVKSPLKTTINAGIGQENKWFAGIEYSLQDAIVFENDVLQSTNVNFTASSKIAVGGFYTPKAESLTNYWSRVTYRTGIYYKSLGLEINNNEIKDFGMSFGLTLPSKRKLSNLNVGFDIGQKGKTGNNLIKENYFNFRLSLSFSDKWFQKRKLN